MRARIMRGRARVRVEGAKKGERRARRGSWTTTAGGVSVLTRKNAPQRRGTVAGYKNTRAGWRGLVRG